ncbi:hypothetical protein [Mesorhizobium sp.]|uniref:hypothetical protein n=2 Tax=Mesorhizobium sp. TaxID=1871066 RepID=UPI00257A3472|nr:hypothetical protein [Mesorhizobium sp.]
MATKGVAERVVCPKGKYPSKDFPHRLGERFTSVGKQELDNLVKIGLMKSEPPSLSEYDGMLGGARKNLTDAQKGLDPDSQFTLLYGAAHRLALAALRREGYRSDNRTSVFQALVHTVGTDKADIQIFLKRTTSETSPSTRGTQTLMPNC